MLSEIRIIANFVSVQANLMLFNSLAFLLFFPVVTALYFIFPHRARVYLLLVASCFFYMFFKPVFILILVLTIVIDYYAGILLEGTVNPSRKKAFLAMSLIVNIGILAVFKYYNFFVGNINDSIHLFGSTFKLPYLEIILPIGLSFHTFQAMSYTIEVYRGNQKAERNFYIYSLYVLFYPQMVAGPIERPQNILHQFYQKNSFNQDRVISGLSLMAYGFFKKIVVADRLALYVNDVYKDPAHMSSPSIFVAMIFFSFQIYCDFSGYSDIAIGAARVMGYDLMTNFRRPYVSKSISEFWTRWHISLSTWFRDYLYIPLGGNRVSTLKYYRNIFIVFLVSGLWHGASWTFIVWGGLHAIFLIVSSATESIRKKAAGVLGLSDSRFINVYLSLAFTFLLVTVSWVFFRAENFDKALLILDRLASFTPGFNMAGKTPFYFIFCLLSITLLLFSYKFSEATREKHSVVFISSVIILVLLIGQLGSKEFIYFQF